MTSMTAHLLVSTEDRERGFFPSHQLCLYEGPLPLWRLTAIDAIPGAALAVWVPTVEHMLADAVLMVGLHVVRDASLLELAGRSIRRPHYERIDVCGDIEPRDADMLREASRKIAPSYHLLLTARDRSHVWTQIDQLRRYAASVEIRRSGSIPAGSFHVK
jgi:hypothetical protein